MKRILLGVILLAACLTQVDAQSIYDADKFTSKDLSGSARFVSMGGALGALGADISTMGVNPAGTGLFRKYDFSGTFNYTMNDQNINYMGNKFDNTKRKSNMNSLGFVISTPVNGSVLKYVNFGFNFSKATNFNTRFGAGANLGDGFTIGHQMANSANNMSVDLNTVDLNDYPYDQNGWLGTVGLQGNLIDFISGPDGKGQFQSTFTEAKTSDIIYKESGGIDQYDFNVAFNLSNRAFLGLTVGVYNVNHNVKQTHKEYYGKAQNGDDELMALTTENSTEGTGVDVKFGTIIRPIESSPFRIGVAVHTPIFYRLTRYTNFFFNSDVWSDEHQAIVETNIDILDHNIYGRDNAFDYRLRTPWKLNLSLGHNVGTVLALGAEYEYQDYASSKFFYRDGSGDEIGFINDQRNQLKQVHTIRLGGEVKVIPEVAFRFGYNLETASFEKSAFKYVHPDSPVTDTAFFNKDGVRNTYTIGMGYMGSMWYVDLAYKYDTRKTHFYPFDTIDLPESSIKMNNSSVLLTLGVRL